jgi:hypothetical protein
MSDPLFEFSISDWTITLYIRNTLEMYLHAWVPLSFLGLIILAGVSSKIKANRKKPKPLLGVVPPRG